MQPTKTAYGIWSGGRFMHFGQPLEEDRFLNAIRLAYEQGIRTFMTADVYGNGAADILLGNALAPFPRESYCLIGAVGHDFYTGQREGSKGYPRFTDSSLRSEKDYGAYLQMAVSKSLERCKTNYFDLLLLHNPDSKGYLSEVVWQEMLGLKNAGATKLVGIAPGPANGFTLDLIRSFEKFGSIIDWAMIILNPMEGWPGSLVLPAAEKFGVKLITRVVDYGGLFHDDVKPGHTFPRQDHRAFRPAGWVEAGYAKMEEMRAIARKHQLTMLQLACVWNLSHSPVETVIPTLIQETGAGAKTIESKISELAELSTNPRLAQLRLSEEEKLFIAQVGNNKGCMSLKGANPDFVGSPEADRWPLTDELMETAQRWGIEPSRDLVCTH